MSGRRPDIRQCRHELRYDACRFCLPNGQDVADFVRENPEGATHEAIAARFGLTKQAIIAIEAKALALLKGSTNRRAA
jgi:hypothetical protein